MSKPAQEIDTALKADRPAHNLISVALLAGIAFVPLVVAAGFLTDRDAASALPGDISVAALRGGLDRGAPERPPSVRAGF